MTCRIRSSRRAWLLLLLMLGLPAPALAQGAGEAPDDPAVLAPAPTAPVVIDGRVLFRVRGAASFSAEDRASLIATRTRSIARDRTIPPEAVVVADTEPVEIRAGDVMLVRIFAADGRVEDLEARELALVWRQLIERAIVTFREEHTPPAVRAAALRAVAGLTVLGVALGIMLWLLARVRRLADQTLERRVRAVGIQSFEVLRADSIWRAIHALIHAVRLIGVAALVLGYAIFALERFPWTRSAGRTLYGWVLAPLTTIFGGMVGQIPSLIFLTVLFVVVRFTLRLLRLFFEAVGSGSVKLETFDAEWAAPTYKIIRLVFVAFAVVVAYPYIPGSGSAAFQGVSLFLGVMFSLGSSSFIGNLIAGYAMTYRRAFRLGDRVKIGEVVGEVTQLRLQATHLRTPKNEEVVIPNATILNGEITNYSTLAGGDGLILHTTVGIGYETPWRQVEAMLLEAARRTPGLLADPRPFVLERALGDFAVTYEINAFTREPRTMIPTYAALHRSILDVFNEHGVQIMTPAYEGDPAEPKVVPKERWFTPPAGIPDPPAP